MAYIPKQISTLVVLGLQIWCAVVVFRQWSDASHKTDAVSGSGSSVYKNDDGRWRLHWEMQGYLSDMNKGPVFPGSIAALVGNVIETGLTATHRAAGIATIPSGPRHPEEDRTLRVGGGTCTGASDTDTCNDPQGVCTTTACECSPNFYGEFCGSNFGELGKLTYATTAGVVTDPIPAGWTNVNDVLYIDQYERSANGLDKLTPINYVTLAAVYLLIALVLVGLVALSGFSDMFSIDGLRTYFALPSVDSALVQSIGVAVSSALMDTLAIILLTGTIFMLAGGTPTGAKFLTTIGIMSSGAIAVDAYMLPLGLVTAVCALTVISRTTRVLQGGAFTYGGKFATVVASVLLIVIVADWYGSMTDLNRELASIPFAAIVIFELTYVLGRLADTEADTLFLGLKSIAVVGGVYIAVRRAANFQPDYLTDDQFFALSHSDNVVEGSPYTNLGPKGSSMCHFLTSEMLKIDHDDASSVAEHWHPYHTTANATKTVDEQWACFRDTGAGLGSMSRWIIIAPLLVYVALAFADGQLSKFQEGLSGSVNFLSAGGGFRRTIKSVQRYTRIRVGEGP